MALFHENSVKILRHSSVVFPGRHEFVGYRFLGFFFVVVRSLVCFSSMTSVWGVQQCTPGALLVVLFV